MNAAQAKRLSLPDLMSRLGYEPTRSIKGGHELWYKSPFRTEQDASFHTSYLGGKWIWNDFGDTGGTVIDFVMRHEECSTREALAFLNRMYQGHLFETPKSRRVGEVSVSQPNLFSFQQQDRAAVEIFSNDRTLEFIAATPITGKTIFSYLEKERGIPQHLVRRYLLRVLYRNRKEGKEYFAFGMKNESGGYEIRAASNRYNFKSALIARDVTLIPGTDPTTGIVNVFEGMLDFLSLLVMLEVTQLRGDALILHSTSSFSRASDVILAKNHSVINGFLDNDRTGRDTAERFARMFSDKWKSQNSRYLPHKDLNAALVAGNSLKPLENNL